MKIKINIDRLQPTLNEINAGKNFSDLINNFNMLRVPFYKTRLFFVVATALTVAVICFTTYFIATENNNKPIVKADSKEIDNSVSKIEENLNNDIVEEKAIDVHEAKQITDTKTQKENIPSIGNISNKNNTIKESKTTLTSGKNIPVSVNIYAHLNGKINGKIDYKQVALQPHLKVNVDSVTITSFIISYVSKNSKHNKYISGNSIPQKIVDDLKNMVNGDKLTISEISAITKSGQKISLNDLDYTLTGTYVNKNETGVLDDELFEK